MKSGDGNNAGLPVRGAVKCRGGTKLRCAGPCRILRQVLRPVFWAGIKSSGAARLHPRPGRILPERRRGGSRCASPGPQETAYPQN